MSEPAPAPASGPAAFRAALDRLLGLARRELWIQSHWLDRRDYGRPVFVEALQAWLLGEPGARCRLLVHSPQRCQQAGGHRLVELARRLPSRIECRALLLPERAREQGERVIVDRRHWLRRDPGERLDFEQHEDAPLSGRAEAESWQRLWEEAPPAREFSDLRL